MPIPDELDSESYYALTPQSRTFENPQASSPGRENLTRQFHPYLELYFQAKHDPVVRTRCKEQKIEARNRDGTQVERYDDFDSFYDDRADTVVDVVLAEMVRMWKAGRHFDDGEKVILAVQSKLQRDGYCYDVSFFYDGPDIYVSFHGYPG